MDRSFAAIMDGDDEPGASQANSRTNSSVGSVLREVSALCGVSSAPQRQPATFAPFTLAHPSHRVRLILDSELPPGKERAAQFVAELTAQCGEAEQLRRFLSPTVVPPLGPPLPRAALPVPSSRTMSQQDSIIRICLNVLSLQRPLIDWLLEQLAVNEDDWLATDGIHASVLSQRGLAAQSLPPTSLPRLLLDQLRMLDVVYDSDALCSKLQEVLEALSTVKAELIIALPDILIDPCFHDKMANCLLAQLRLTDALLLPVLDCLSRLSLTSRQKEKTVEAVTPLVASVKEKSLPALIRFLLQMTSDDSVQDILTTIRVHLPQLAHDDSSDSSGGKGGKEEREQEVSGAVLIVEALRSGLQQNQLACKSYLEMLKADEKECKAADVLILFIIHSLPHNKQLSQKAADTLCKKLLAGLVSPALLHSSIVSHVGCVRPMFDSVAVLAEQMVRKHGDRAMREAGGAMQVDLFLAFDDRAQRMTIVQSWLQQLGSRESAEMDNALNCLQTIGNVKGGVRSLAMFFEYLKPVLQYLDDYKLSQIRTLFQILASLAFKKDAVAARGSVGQHVGEDGSSGSSGCHPFDTSLQVFVQKELYAPSLRDQRIGIVAVVALMQPIAAYSPHTEQRLDSQHEQRGALPDVLCSLLDQLFESLVKCTNRSPSAQSFLYDELSLALDSRRLLNMEVLQRVDRYFKSQYQPHLFVRRAHGEHPLPLTVDRQTIQLNCKDQLAGPDLTANRSKLSFNITPALLQPSPDRQLMALPAELRLLAACCRADRPADDFVQLLIAPFTLPVPVGRNQVEWLDHFQQQSAHLQRVWISSHFHTIQALREIVNAFSSTTLRLDSRDQEHLAPCLVHRFQQLIVAEDELRAMLRCMVDFTAQQLLSMADSTDETYMKEMGTLDGTMKADDEFNHYTVLNGKVHITRKKKGKAQHGKRKRAASSDEVSSDSETDDSEKEEASKKRKKRAAKKQQATQPKDEDKAGPFDAVIRPLLRPLTIDVMQLLCTSLSTDLVVAAERQRRQDQEEKQAKKQRHGDVDHEGNMLLLYKPPAGTADSSVPHLSVRALSYLMTELRHKMEAVLTAASSHTPVSPFFAKRASPTAVIPTSPAADTPISLMAALSPVLRGLHDHYLVLNSFLDTSDMDDDEDIDREEMAACLIACVHVVRMIVNCPTLTAPANRAALQSVMIDMLGAVRQPSGSVAELSQIGEQSLATLCELLISRLRNCLHTFRCINDAVEVVGVIREVDSIRTLAAQQEEHVKQPSTNKRLHDLAHRLLDKEFPKKATLRKQNVGELVSLLIRHADDPRATMKNIAARMLTLAQLTQQKSKKKKRESGADEEEVEQEAEEGGDASTWLYRHSLTKQTVPLWLVPMIEYSSRLLSTAHVDKPKSGGYSLEPMQQLVRLVAELLNVTKLYPRNLTLHKHCIRVTIKMIDSFTKSLDTMGKLLQGGRRQGHEPAVKQTLSAIQKVTRAFNALCMHVKEQQTGSLLTILPQAKMAYEKWSEDTLTHAHIYTTSTSSRLYGGHGRAAWHDRTL